MREANLTGIDDIDIMDLRTFTLISSRPRKTRAHEFVGDAAEAAPIVGNRKAIVLLVDFSDKAAATGQAHYNDLLFSVGSYATGSMRDFYKEASYGQLDVTGQVAGSGGPTAGWFRAPKPKSYYTDGNFGFNAYPKNAQKLAEDVIDLANPFVNFSSYDNDGDGFVEAVIIICAGSGGEQTGNVNDIWSHKWNITTKTVDGVKIDRYFMAPEDGRVGVMAHELGHLLLGLPDLYDTDYSSRGTGNWDLMAGGSWNGGGNKPAHPTAWCKVKAGWVNPTVIFNSEQTITVRPYKDFKDIFKLPVGAVDSKEYFLLSNRRKNGFDVNLPGDGLIIEHIDENKTGNTDENHYLVDVEQADGLRQLNTNANSGDANDPFPTASNNQFTVSSTPNSKAYSGSDSKVSVTAITRSGDNITAKVNVGGAAALGWITKKAVQVYATPHSMNAWVYLEATGWRKINELSTNGVTSMFDALCQARIAGSAVTVEADSGKIFTLYY
ncbi:M6 family metalloprotease domain-containing protein [Chitinophaga nivalis]|uniref:M6 family metalloprotease domain-containing protein n=1 Tax=Chitinophaga nivalis TaxID=2991709 RepID=A0ABT3IKZ7_9BACT|nr:M6 family metalloprotease domain-containing protein [Chitinophaga nivalis]MCW3465672.1 M6 family metalloprotease domain-containing protein [Chitinophaga nivalis]MCW3484637.1 M6 family metalloprotease domain-containing protein [Chitinophaga nivalis]